MSTGSPERGGWVRYAVFIIGGLETVAAAFVLWLGISGLSSSEALSRSLSHALLLIYGIPYLVTVLPALMLAALNRWVELALALCTVGVLAVVGLAFVMA
jgi:hypothetical protein